MIIFSGLAFGQEQKMSKEEVLDKVSKMMISIKDGTKQTFSATRDYESFRAQLIGREGRCSTTEGENLLTKVYELHTTKQSDEQIHKTYDGKEIAYALKKYQELENNDGKIFNNNTNELSRAAAGGGCGCSWYQFGCLFDCYFIQPIVIYVINMILDGLI